MSHNSAMAAGSVSPVRTEQHIVRCQPKDANDVEWTTLDYAVHRLEGYYRDDPRGWIRETLMAGTPLQTISFWYQVVP